MGGWQAMRQGDIEGRSTTNKHTTLTPYRLATTKSERLTRSKDIANKDAKPKAPLQGCNSSKCE